MFSDKTKKIKAGAIASHKTKNTSPQGVEEIF